MKIVFVIFTLFVAASAAPKLGKEYEKVRDFCIEKEGVTGDDLESLKKFQYPDVPRVRCYTKCMALQLRVWHLSFLADPLISQIKLKRRKAEVKPGVLKCLAGNKDNLDQCSWIYREFKCLIDEGLWDEEAIMKS